MTNSLSISRPSTKFRHRFKKRSPSSPKFATTRPPKRICLVVYSPKRRCYARRFPFHYSWIRSPKSPTHKQGIDQPVDLEENSDPLRFSRHFGVTIVNCTPEVVSCNMRRPSVWRSKAYTVTIRFGGFSIFKAIGTVDLYLVSFC